MSKIWCAGEAAQASETEGVGRFVRFYNLESKEEGILWDVKPSYVIMYDPDMAFIRQIEVRFPVCTRPDLKRFLACPCFGSSGR